MASKIARVCTQNGLTTSGIALLLRVTPLTVRMKLNGESKFTDEELAILAKYCRVTVNELRSED